MFLEHKFMKCAIAVANKGSGFVNPKPLYGAVLVKDNRIIGEGYYDGINDEVAEIKAIKNSEKNPSGADLYLNMEPILSHEDIDFILKSEIKKIYVGILDPILKGKGVEALRTKGIEVETGLLQDECEELNEIYLHYITKRIPFVFTKWAMTLDGKLATRTGDSKWISNEKSLKFVHELRQRVAAILVGENTVKLDNPMLTTRLEGVKICNPLRVIISKYGDIPNESNVLKVNDNTKTLIISSTKISKNREDYFLHKKIDVTKLEEKNGHIDFKDIVKSLGDMGIDSIFIEGGSGILGSAFESGIVNKVYAVVAPKLIGGKEAVTPVGGMGIEKMRDALVLKKVTHEIVGNDVIFKGYLTDGCPL
jgi:diaminohydroxyphosphoribosylaminopyrimidine deaminase/5-amino-6-(5-phosphoribosylamino)uracil reductase